MADSEPPLPATRWGRRHGLLVRTVKITDDLYDLPDHAPDWGNELELGELTICDGPNQRLRARGQREQIPWERKVELFASHHFACIYCGTIGELVIDHVVPVAAGGSSADTNLVPACRPCNTQKRARELREWLGTRPDIDREAILRRWREAGRKGEIAWLM